MTRRGFAVSGEELAAARREETQEAAAAFAVEDRRGGSALEGLGRPHGGEGKEQGDERLDF